MQNERREEEEETRRGGEGDVWWRDRPTRLSVSLSVCLLTRRVDLLRTLKTSLSRKSFLLLLFPSPGWPAVTPDLWKHSRSIFTASRERRRRRWWQSSWSVAVTTRSHLVCFCRHWNCLQWTFNRHVQVFEVKNSQFSRKRRKNVTKLKLQELKLAAGRFTFFFSAAWILL